MKLLLELPPASRSLIESYVEKTARYVDGYFIPCAPAGYPLVDCFAAGVLLVEKYSVSVLTSLRVRDYSLNHMVEKAKTAREFRFKGVLVTRGDPPKHEGDCSAYTTEFVVDYLRKAVPGVRLGIVLSTKYSTEEMARRVEFVKPDFTVVIRFSKEYLSKLSELAKGKHRSENYVFLLLGIGKNIELFESLKQPYVTPSEFQQLLTMLEGIASGVVVSTPRELDSAVAVLEEARRSLKA